MKKKQPEGYQISAETIGFYSEIMQVFTAPIVCNRSGKEKVFVRLDFPDWVNVVAVTPQNQIVLVNQYRFGSDQEELEIPGGAIEKGEGPVVAGCRELLEECGYSGDNCQVIGKVNPNPALQRNNCYTVLVTNAVRTTEQSMDDMEDIKVVLRPAEVLLHDFLMGKLEISHGLALNGLSFYLHTLLQDNPDLAIKLISS